MADATGLDAKLAEPRPPVRRRRHPAGHPGGALATRTSSAGSGRELARLEPVVAAYRELGEVRAQLAGAREMRDDESDEEMKAMARDEIAELEARETQLIEDLKVSLLPRDPNDDRNVIVEIRAGAGGEEAALFATELLRMYSRYAAEHRYQTDLMSLNETGIGGTKEAILEIAGDGAYSRFKFEGGVHRVQRVPVDRVERPDPHQHGDGDRDARGGRARGRHRRGAGPPDRGQAQLRAGRPVGQHHRLRGADHPPAVSGLVVEIQDEKSQHKNKAKAMSVLRSRLYDLELAKQRERDSATRRSDGRRRATGRRRSGPTTSPTTGSPTTGSARRSTTSPGVLEGQLDALIDALVMADQADRLRNLTESDDVASGTPVRS